ncbi:cytochrome c oxidase assembly protein [Humibacter ginsenosidimutans]|uniref:Cytochrome c oxidase assembly protein n=1 Tax=Humibacter ginsenosidimutans TaxID=2599293 RepID=A0A5B8M5M2_9MICO|nr:cytochrome c oxidase assembly protein [Humibacter ginsenosidimutans]QDZ14892.1 cytochrome c oxidase assembly protein [Humibacter ginsenosidimutans]
MPPFSVVLTTFRFDWVAAVTLVVLAAAYVVGIIAARRRGTVWPALPTLGFFVLGLGSYAAVSFGFLGAFTYELRWAEITRWALLLFLVPWLLALGRPVALARAALNDRGRAGLDSFLQSRFVRTVGNAVFEPIFTMVIFLLFVTPLAAWLRLSPIPQTFATVFIPLFGLLTIVPIAESTRKHLSLSLMFEFMIAMAALIFDAIPGILLRLHNVVIDGVTNVQAGMPSWFPNPLHDQHLAGDFIWFIAEVADIPIIIILFLRWARTDDREAKAIDELSDEEMERLTQAHLNDWHR